MLVLKYHIHDKGIIIDTNQLNYVAYEKKKELALSAIVNVRQSRTTSMCVRFSLRKLEPE